MDGRNATGGPCAPSILPPQPRASPPNPGPRDLRWLLDVVDASPVPRRADWRSGLGFTAPVPPATDEETAALRDADPESFAAATMSQRRAAVAASARHAWRGYRQHAWPADELAPVSRRGVSWLDVGLTVVDSYDTLLLMGLDEEAADARAWLASSALTFDSDKNANVFESTIRMLGGLVSAHTLGGDTPDGDLLRKALDLAEKLAPAFQTATGIPIMDVNFKTGDPHHPKWTQKSSLSEAGTLVLEWEALEEALRRAENVTVGRDDEDERDADSDRDADADDDAVEVMYGFCPEGGGLKEYAAPRGVSCEGDGLTPRARRRRASATSTLPALAGRWYRRDIASGARRAFVAVADAVWHPENDGLVPTAVSAGTAAFDRGSAVTLGAHGDSYYEYLLKHWLHAGKPEGGEAAYLRAMDGVATHLLRRSGGDERREAAAEAAAEKRSAAAAAFAASVGVRWNVAGTGTATPSRSRRRRWFDADPVEDRRAPREPSSPPPAGPGLLYVAERRGGVDGEMSHKMDHLACFLPGTLALGYAEGLGERWGGGDDERERAVVRALRHLGFSGNATHLDVARELARTCVQMYARTPAGLAPEIAHFPLSGFGRRGGRGETTSRFGDLIVKENDAHNLLRPETVESLWMLWRVTGEREWRDAGWEMWRAWERHAKVDSGGYAGVESVLRGDGGEKNRVDKMESFWLGETLKYLYLLFTDDPAVLPSSCFVFNTEAHPVPVLTNGASDRSACVERVVREHAETIAARHATPPRYE